MTAQDTELVEVRSPSTAERTSDGTSARTASKKASGKAYERRNRRQQVLPADRLTKTGSPIASALAKLPFVALIMLMLAGGVVGVLWLNTMSDATGLRASQSRLAQTDLTDQIQADTRYLALMQGPAQLATQATAQGLVPPGDAAMLEVGSDGKWTVIGTPTPVPVPAVGAPPAAPTMARAQTPARTTAPTAGPTGAARSVPAQQPAGTVSARTPVQAAVATTPARPPASRTTVGAKTTAPGTTVGAKATAPGTTLGAKTTAPRTAAAARTTPSAGTTAGSAANRSPQPPVTTGVRR